MKEYALSELARSVKPGVYRHFKGGEYEVILVGRLSEDRDQEMVVYKSLLKDLVWIRPLDMFTEEVDRPEFSYKGPRFKFIREK